MVLIDLQKAFDTIETKENFTKENEILQALTLVTPVLPTFYVVFLKDLF